MDKLSIQRWVFNLHLVLSVVFGIFITLVAITGAAIGFEAEIDRMLHREMSYVTPGERVLTLEQIRGAISSAYSGEPVVAILPTLAADQAWQVVIPSGIAYVNPYTGQSLGLRTRGDTFLGRVRAVHIGLIGGTVGRGVVKWATVAAVPLLLSGIILWWPRKTVRVRGSIRGRRFWFDLHSAFGITAAVFLLLLAGTGGAMAFADTMRPYLYRITGAPPSTSRATYTVKLVESYELTPDRAVAIARKAAPQTVPYRIQFPSFGGTYVVDLIDARDKLAGERNSVVIDPHTGEILLIRSSGEVHTADRVMAGIVRLHVGSLVGSTGKAVLCLASFLTLAISLSGSVMLWRRSFKHQHTLFR